jgi:uncharacterized protein with WD repeat
LKTSPIFSSNGSFVAYLSHDLITIHSAHSGDILSQISCPDVENLEFNASGTFLTTWSRPTRVTSAAASGSAAVGRENFKVWHVATSTVVGSYHQRTYRKGLLQWIENQNEETGTGTGTGTASCLRLVTNEIHQNVLLPTIAETESASSTLSTDASTSASSVALVRVSKLHHPNVTQFSLSPRVSPTEGYVALFTPEHSGKTARVSLFRFNPCHSSATSTGEESFVSTGVSRSLFRSRPPCPSLLTLSLVPMNAKCYGVLLLVTHS